MGRVAVPESGTITGQSTENRQGRDRAATLGTVVAAFSFLLEHRQGQDRAAWELLRLLPTRIHPRAHLAVSDYSRAPQPNR